MRSHRKRFLALGALVTGAALLAACSSSQESSSSSSSASPTTSSSASALPQLNGQEFAILGPWTKDEQVTFQKVIDDFNAKTGAKGTYTSGGDDVPTILGTKVAGGAPPDVAVIASPGTVEKFAKEGKLKPANPQVQAAVGANYSPLWTELGSVDGKLYSVYADASNKSTFWYSTKAFETAGVTDEPKTWDDLVKTAQTLADSGVQVPIAVAGGDGWTLTDWFENVYIRTAGLDSYDKLTKHEIPWTDPSVTKALETLKKIWGNKALVGDPATALQTSFTQSVANTFKNDAPSAMVYEASFVATQIGQEVPTAKVGTDAKFFPFPEIDGSPQSVVGGGDAVVAFTDNPAAQAFLQYMASTDAAKLMVSSEGSGFASANKTLQASDYPNETLAKVGADIVAAGDKFRFDMSDQTPSAFGGTKGQGQWKALQDFLGNGDVAAAQAQLESAAKAAYK
ncbi:extracellular solute-binding protein [Rhodococcus sp. X156]|uniref:ABC transporter substrate-binding protein n=1 Tax=Rhodococcus sp. X156 TaxID=2499145 RepID=UPI000FDB120D|nr:extracellular solute-binding protein [Rhodococcus sp. X156]